MPSSRPVAACVRRSTPTGRATAAVLAAGASLALLAGCASATDGAGTAGAGAGAGSAVPAAATSAAPASPALTALAGRVVTAVSTATSVHVAADLTGIPGLPVPVDSVAADVALAGGKPTAAAVTAGQFALRYVDGTAWVALPGDTAKPWWVLTTDSSYPVVAAAAGKLADAKAKLAALDPSALLAAASGLTNAGPATVGGTAATRYTFTVDATALATALGVSSPATVTGSVPVQLWLDSADRPVRVTATPTVAGTARPVTVTLSGWNAPVSITAPDPAQVNR